MQMRPDIQIICMTKAMRDVVIPAVDPANELAVEQARLVVAMLDLMARQLPLQFSFDRDELHRLAGYAAKLAAIQVSEEKSVAAIRAVIDDCAKAESLLVRCASEPGELLDAINLLRKGMSTVVNAIAEEDNIQAQQQLERLVLEMSAEQFLRDRALLGAPGFGTDAAALPDITVLLAPAAAGDRG